jgi:hypothetical protein
MQHIKWTPEVRADLFRRVKKRTGTYRSWEKKLSPGYGLDRSFTILCGKIGREIGATTEAVKMQVLFGAGLYGVEYWQNEDGGVSKQVLQNLVAALDAGFIDEARLAEVIRTAANEPGLRAAASQHDVREGALA